MKHLFTRIAVWAISIVAGYVSVITLYPYEDDLRLYTMAVLAGFLYTYVIDLLLFIVVNAIKFSKKEKVPVVGENCKEKIDMPKIKIPNIDYRFSIKVIFASLFLIILYLFALNGRYIKDDFQTYYDTWTQTIIVTSKWKEID